MRSYAQTNLQLHVQLRELEIPEADHAAVARAYRMAADLFSGRYRGSGKPFVAHLVGTASILASRRAGMPVVLAGLLHAVYEQGDFGLGLRGRHADKRREVAGVIGEKAEALIQRYFELPWTDAAIAAMSSRAAALSEAERSVVVIRLANELEDYLDLGLTFCANATDRITRAAGHLERQMALARELGYDDLATDLCDAVRANQGSVLPPGVQSEHGHSSLRAPRSYRVRFIAALRAGVARRLALRAAKGRA